MDNINYSPRMKFVDLFCGAGGVTSGIEKAQSLGKKIADVIACVNHDPIAIESHRSNHPNAFHYAEDIRTLNIRPLIQLVNSHREDYICLWASLECTNFSKAKGGLPRDADSRTLANDLFRYIDGINPDYVFIENVEEFMSWGPLNEQGKPISKLEGIDYIKWVENVKSRGYNFDWKILNSADYGAYTSRKRFFGIFAKRNLPITFPEPTHSKKPQNDIFMKQKKWKPVKEVLDFNDKGESIFGRKKNLSENTLKRIYAGLLKYVAGGKDVFLNKYHGNGENILGIEDTCSTLSTKDRLALVSCFLINRQYNNTGSSIENPCFTLIASMNKRPGYLIQTSMCSFRNQGIKIDNTDSDTLKKIKEFMILFGIVDIKMRMLRVSELLKIQGFSEGYILKGNQSDQKKFIGNSVVPIVAQKLIESIYESLIRINSKVA